MSQTTTVETNAAQGRQAGASPSTIAFTIVSKNYVHFARTLMQSVAERAPGWRRFVLLVDENRGEIDLSREPYEAVEIASLSLPEPRKFAFRYTILELNTAVKPWMFEWLFERERADRVVYLDPDICLYRHPDELERALDEGASMVLTPHLTGPLDDQHRPHELDIVRAGSYNLGFLALARGAGTARFLRWWQGKLEKHCVVDHDRGFFVDQKWLDLAPGMFENVTILRHEGYNVAYWNLQHRRMVRDGERFSVNGVPLVFFHFSGLDMEAPEGVSKYQDRFRLSDLPALGDLVRDYIARLRENGARDVSRLPYAFANFESGEPIPDCVRRLYRQDPRFIERAGDDPFKACTGYLNQPIDADADIPVTVLMRHVWSERPDVQQAFPRLQQEDRRRFVEWFVHTGAREMGIPGIFVRSAIDNVSPPARVSRSTGASRDNRANDVHAPRRSLPELLALEGAEFVMQAYQAVLGRPADHRGLTHFLAVLRERGSKAEILWRLRYSHEGRLKKTDLPGLWRDFWLEYPRSRIRRVASRGLRSIARRLRGRPSTHATSLPAISIPPAIAPVPGPSPIVTSPGCECGIADGDWTRHARQRFGRSNYIGFYDWGDQHDGLVWMARSASVRLPGERVAGVRIVGLYDEGPHRLANGVPETVVSVSINDQVVGRFTLTRTGPFDVEIAVANRDFAAPVFLTLAPSSVFVPAALGINADPRELSLRIARIDVDGAALLDFSRGETPYRRPDRSDGGVGMNIVGYLRSEHGIGESARICAQSAEAARIPFALCDFNAGNSARVNDLRWSERIGNENPHPVNVFHVNADQMTLARETLKEAFFRNRYNIGFWHWELPDFPDRFQSGFAFLDEVWVPSFFVMNAVSAKSPVPVVRMPHAIEFRLPPGVDRGEFGLPADRFLFLSMYDMHSAQGRKNPHAVIDAFRRAFPDSNAVGLVIKVQNTKSNPEDFAELQQELGDSPNMLLIDRTMTRTEVYGLEAVCDSFVSLHRSEGFGLGLAESMYLGKPVIGTNWSGNTDFMNAGNSCPVNYRLVELDRDYGTYYRKGNTWAEPDVEHAAWYMRKLVEDEPWRQSIASTGQRWVRTELSPRRIGALYGARLQVIAGL